MSSLSGDVSPDEIDLFPAPSAPQSASQTLRTSKVTKIASAAGPSQTLSRNSVIASTSRKHAATKGLLGKRNAFSLLGKSKPKAPKLTSAAAGPGGKPPTDGKPASGRVPAWYHHHFHPSADEHKSSTVAELRANNMLVVCNHCSYERPFNPSTKFGTHLLTGCQKFKETSHWSSPDVLKALSDLVKKVGSHRLSCQSFLYSCS
jgi:hypothetical protein